MILCSILLLILLVVFPEITLAGSKYGATLWLSELLPTLLPFFVAIRLFQESMPNIAFKRPALLLGLLCGYPNGATLVSEQYKRNYLTSKKAYFYLSFVNNPSPMFILAFCTTTILHMNYRESLLLFFLVILSGLLGGLLCYQIPFKESRSSNSRQSDIISVTHKVTLSQKLDSIILSSFVLMIKIGGYVILFSILGQFLLQLISSDSPIGLLPLGALEITCGISYLKIASISLPIKKVLTTTLLTFGGLSAAAQTSSVLTQSELSIIPYVINKIINAVIAFGISYLLFCIL